jgi:hypothetical protein
MRKQRSDSTETMVEAFRAAATDRHHAWPAEVVPLPEDPAKAEAVLVIWRSLQKSRSHNLWLPADLLLLAFLALSLRQGAEYNEQLERHGPMIAGGKHGDKLVRSPILDVLQTTLARCQSLASKLGIGSVTVDNRTVKNQVLLEASAADAPADELLAGFEN